MLAFSIQWLYIIRACLRQEMGHTMPKTVEKYGFPARQDAGSCCAIREFLLRIVGPKEAGEGVLANFF